MVFANVMRVRRSGDRMLSARLQLIAPSVLARVVPAQTYIQTAIEPGLRGVV